MSQVGKLFGVAVGAVDKKPGFVSSAIKTALNTHLGNGAHTGIDLGAAAMGSKVIAATSEPLKEVAHGLGQTYVGKAVRSGGLSTLYKNTDRTFYNGYTGIKPSGVANALGWGGAAAYVGISAMQAQHSPNPGKVEYDGQAPVFTADGMGVSKAPSLGADGSLVFGLNSMRKGGR